MARERMDVLIDDHFRAEETGDVAAILSGFGELAEHDVAGRPGGTIRGYEPITAFYRRLLSDLAIDRFEPVRRWYGDEHTVDESILHAPARGRPFGLEGRGRRVGVRVLHVFEFGEGLIRRESAWLGVASLQGQLSDGEVGDG